MLQGFKNVVGGGKSKDSKETPTRASNPASESKNPEISTTKTSSSGDSNFGFHNGGKSSEYVPSDPVAAAEINKLKNEIKKYKDELYQQQSAPVKKQAAASGSVEEADAKLYETELQLDSTSKKLELCKKELNDAITKYRLLISETNKTRDAEKNACSCHGQVMDGSKKDVANLIGQHQQELEIYNKKIGCLNTEIKLKEALIDKLKGDMADTLLNRGDDSKLLIAAHTKVKNQHANEFNHVVNDLDEASEKLLLTEKALDQKDKRNKDLEGFAVKLQGDNDFITNKLKDKSKECEDLKEEVQEVKSDNKKLSNQVSGLQTQLDTSNKEKSQLMGENMGLREDIGKVKNEAQSSRFSNDKELDMLRDSERKLSQSLATNKAELSRLISERDDLAQKCNKLQNDNIELLKELNSLRDAAGASAASAAKHMEQLNREQQQREDAFRAERNALLAKIEDMLREIQVRKDEMRIYQARIDKINAEKAAELANLMTLHAAEIEANNSELMRARGDISQSKMRINQLEDEIRDLRKELENEKAHDDDLEHQLQLQRFKVGELQQQIHELESLNSALQSKFDNMKADYDNMKMMYDNSLSAVEQLKNQLSSLAKSKADAISELENKIKTLMSKSSSSESSGLQSQQAIVNLKMEMSQLEAQLAQKKGEIKNLQSQKADLEQELAVQVEVALTSKNKLTTLQESINTTTRQRIPDGLQEKIDQLTYQLRQTQIIAMDVQQNMIPIEETIVQSTSNSSSSSSEATKSASSAANSKSK